MSIPTDHCTPETHSSLHLAAHRMILNHYQGHEDSPCPGIFSIYQLFGLSTKQCAIVGLAGPMAEFLDDSGGDDFDGLFSKTYLCGTGRLLVGDYVFVKGRVCDPVTQSLLDEVCKDCRDLVESRWSEIMRPAGSTIIYECDPL